MRVACLSDCTVAAITEGVAGPALDAAQLHIDGCPACRRLLAAASQTASAGPDTVEPPGLPIGRGTAVGRYRIDSLLGAGGMGAVYAAHDPDLDRRVAIKVLHDSAPDSGDPLSLRREARAMARAVHANVVAVYDVGRHGNRAFVVMELVEGRSLRAWMEEPGRSIDSTVAAFRDAGRGLAAAHRAGLLHGDFKPDNVLVADDGSVKVGDFGLACCDAALREPRRPVAGSPAYLAPEVLEQGGPSAASDQFSFCVSLWEALYGRRPFASATLFATLLAARAGSIQPSPGRRVPGWLRRAILRGLSADPAGRYPSMDALLDALDRGARRKSWLPRAAVAAALLAGITPAGLRPIAARTALAPLARLGSRSCAVIQAVAADGPLLAARRR